MKTFKTSSGFVFKFWEPGEKVVLLEKGSIIPKGSIVKVMSNAETLSRDVMVMDIFTNRQEQFNCLELGELVGETYQISQIEPEA